MGELCGVKLCAWGQLCGEAVWGNCDVTSNPHKRYSVCPCTVWLGRGLLYQSLFDSVLIMNSNNIAICLGMNFLYWSMCRVTPHFGCIAELR